MSSYLVLPIYLSESIILSHFIPSIHLSIYLPRPLPWRQNLARHCGLTGSGPGTKHRCFFSWIKSLVKSTEHHGMEKERNAGFDGFENHGTSHGGLSIKACWIRGCYELIHFLLGISPWYLRMYAIIASCEDSENGISTTAKRWNENQPSHLTDSRCRWCMTTGGPQRKWYVWQTMPTEIEPMMAESPFL